MNDQLALERFSHLYDTGKACLLIDGIHKPSALHLLPADNNDFSKWLSIESIISEAPYSSQIGENIRYVDNPNISWQDHIYGFFKQSEYRKIYTDYKRLLRRTKHYYELSGDHIELFYQLTEQWINPRKKELIDNIIECSYRLSIEYNNQLEGKFIFLESELAQYLTKEDRRILNASGVRKSKPNLLEFIVKLLRSAIIFLKRKMLQNYKRDLRMIFQSIVHFLFKNMDDESDAVGQLQKGNKSNLINKKFIFHGSQRNDTTTGDDTIKRATYR